MACMVKNHHLTRAISAASFAEVRRQLTYKTTWRHSRLVVADRFYPSSKTCSACEAVKAELSLAERRYICEACGVIEDRDVNAARNLAQLYPCGEREAQASHSPHERNARGWEGSGRAVVRRNPAAKPAPTNRAVSRGSRLEHEPVPPLSQRLPERLPQNQAFRSTVHPASDVERIHAGNSYSGCECNTVVLE